MSAGAPSKLSDDLELDDRIPSVYEAKKMVVTGVLSSPSSLQN
jgi:hypothetical protein